MLDCFDDGVADLNDDGTEWICVLVSPIHSVPRFLIRLSEPNETDFVCGETEHHSFFADIDVLDVGGFDAERFCQSDLIDVMTDFLKIQTFSADAFGETLQFLLRDDVIRWGECFTPDVAR